jgi:hypothetical protein
MLGYIHDGRLCWNFMVADTVTVHMDDALFRWLLLKVGPRLLRVLTNVGVFKMRNN